MSNNYICERCHYTTNNRSKFKRHLGRKYMCHPVYSNTSISNISDKYFDNINNCDKIINDDNLAKFGNNKFVCRYCEDIFKHKTSLITHENKRCKTKKKNDEVTILKQKISDLEEQLKEAKIIKQKNLDRIKKSLEKDFCKKLKKINVNS